MSANAPGAPMLTIRADQMEAFDEAARDRFRRRLCAYLRAELPRETRPYSERRLHEHVWDCEQRARGFGIVTELGIAQFACLTFDEARFDEDPEVRRFLTLPRTEPTDQIDWLARTWDDERWREDLEDGAPH